MSARKKATKTVRPGAGPAPGPRIVTDPESAIRPVSGLPTAPKREATGEGDQAARQAAFDAEYSWRGIPLLAYGSGRESVWLQQRHGAGAPPLNEVFDDIDLFFPDACRILYLCSHTPDQFRIYRHDPLLFQEAIETWANENIPRIPEENTRLSATLLAMQIINQSGVNRHEPAPPPVKGGTDEGN